MVIALEDAVEAAISRAPLRSGDTLIVGVSGGPDSLALLHRLTRMRSKQRWCLHVGHLDHAIREEASAADARFVVDTCRRWGVACTVCRVDVSAIARERGGSLEEVARRERYRFLSKLAESRGATVVAVGHNADDQVETVLMHLLRGSGLAGLRGMRPLTRLDALHVGRVGKLLDTKGPQWLWRPLLAVPRAEIVRYCEAQGLTPRIDRTNADRTYFRNRLRHELIPYLESYNPRIRDVVCHMAEVVAGDYEVLQNARDSAWTQVVVSESSERIVFALDAFRALPVGLKRSLIREAVRRLRRSWRDLGWVHVNDALNVIARGRIGSRATLPQGLELTLNYDYLHFADRGAALPQSGRPSVRGTMRVPIDSVTDMGNGWRASTRVAPLSRVGDAWRANRDRYRAYLDVDLVRLPMWFRPRAPGDRFEPLGLGGHQDVRDYMINARIPAHERNSVPLLVDDDGRILWIVGQRLAQCAAIGPNTHKVLVIVVRRDERTNDIVGGDSRSC